MKIGILGAGTIGSVLAPRLAAAGHNVKIANSRGPDTIDAHILKTGAQAVTAEGAMRDVDVAILSMPYAGLEKVRDLIAALPEQVVVIDTSNYFPQRDATNPEIEAGKVESEWVQDLLGRPIVKAWNAIANVPFVENARPEGHPERVAIPVAGDHAAGREVAITLVNDTGFDGYDAGVLATSWRQQPGAPVYCTNLKYDEIGQALDAAERERLPKRRDLGAAIFAERFGWPGTIEREKFIEISRALQM